LNYPQSSPPKFRATVSSPHPSTVAQKCILKKEEESERPAKRVASISIKLQYFRKKFELRSKHTTKFHLLLFVPLRSSQWLSLAGVNSRVIHIVFENS
jgi:hypothetical protein